MKTTQRRKQRQAARQQIGAEVRKEQVAHLHRQQVWDLPTRASHWAIIILFLVQILSSQFSLLTSSWHLWAGYLLLMVLLFRFGWGLVGSQSARFAPMIGDLRQLPAYLPILFSTRPTRWPGHNPVGTLSSLLLLFLLLVSSVSGLFIESWAEVRGPLAERVGRGTSLFMGDLHGLVRWPLYLLVVIHILAVLSYLVFKREDRITPIFAHGRILVRQPRDTTLQSNWRAALVLMACIALVLAIVFLGPIA